MSRPKTDECQQLTASNIKAFIGSIDTVLCDCDGVLYHLETVIPGVPEAVQKLKSLGKTVIYITNYSIRTRKDFLKKLTAFGYPATEDNIIGSAYATAQFLSQKRNYKGKVYAIGSPGLAEELQAAGLKTVGVGPDTTADNLKAAQDFVPDPEVKCVVIGLDEQFSYLKAAKAMVYLQNKDCLFLSTNPDCALPTPSGRTLPDVGPCTAMIAVASQREPEVIGKPNQPMFDVVMAKHKLDPKKTIMIGDRLDTDILFATQCGLQSMLVLTGITTLDDVKKKQESKSPNDKKQIPNYYLPSLADLAPLLKKI